MEMNDVVKLIGLFITISVVGWGVIKWLLSRIDKVHSVSEENHQRVSQNISHLHSRVDEVKDTYVKRSDLDRDFKSMERRMESVEKSIADSRAETNQRLDRMLMLLGRLLHNQNGSIDDQ